MTETLHSDLTDEVATITMDDGKANALSHAVLEGIHAHLDAAERDARAVVLAGRPGRFSGGFDLEVMRSGPEQVRDLVGAGAELILRIHAFPLPVVVACTGHAVAAGAIILLAADVRVGTEGEFKIGLNEVAIGMPVPTFAVELARDRLVPAQLVAAVNHARLYRPDEAVEVGYLDAVAHPDSVATVAHRRAHELGSTVHDAAFRLTRENLRGARNRELRAELAADLARFTTG